MQFHFSWGWRLLFNGQLESKVGKKGKRKRGERGAKRRGNGEKILVCGAIFLLPLDLLLSFSSVFPFRSFFWKKGREGGNLISLSISPALIRLSGISLIDLIYDCDFSFLFLLYDSESEWTFFCCFFL